MGNAYLLVHEPPDAAPLMGPVRVPAQDTGDHERKQNEIADKCGDDTDSGVQDTIKQTAPIGQVPPGCDDN